MVIPSQLSSHALKSRASIARGYARNPGESRFPHLWVDLIAAWVPCLGPWAYNIVPNLAIRKNARLYDVRRSVATRLMASGVDLRTVMSITGHTTPGVLLKHYTQVVRERQREAVEGLFEGVAAEDLQR